MMHASVRVTCFVLCLLLGAPAFAGWTGCKLFDANNECVDYDIADIFSDVAKANKVLDDNKPVMQQLLDQRDHWKNFNGNALLITEGVEDIFSKLPTARDNFLAFTGSPKCAQSTPCFNFQTDLIIFFNELDGLKSRFPALRRAGLKDRGAIELAIMNTPPFVLYAMYRAQENIPDWQKLPTDLKDIFDELADPEIFELDLEGPGLSSVSTAAATPEVFGASAFAEPTRTEKFCAARADRLDGIDATSNRNGADQVRINRIVLTVTLLTDVWKFALDQVPDDIDIGVSLVGEGGTLGIPSAVFTWFFKIVPLASESILKAIEVHHKNLELCRSRFNEIEGRLASCGYFAEFALDAHARDEYFQLVQRRFDMATEAGIGFTKSEFMRDKSLVKLKSGLYRQAFESLCESYRNIGVAN
jgi:hypothetical protein